MSLYDKLTPDLRMLNLLKTKEGIVPEFSQETYKTNLGENYKNIFRYSKAFLLSKHSVWSAGREKTAKFKNVSRWNESKVYAKAYELQKLRTGIGICSSKEFVNQ